MDHPWATVDDKTNDGGMAFDMVRDLDPNLFVTPNPELIRFLRRINADLPVIEKWEERSDNLLLDVITFENLKLYHDVMTAKIPDLGFPSMIEIVHRWQNNLFEGQGSEKNFQLGDKDTEDGRMLLAGELEASKIYPRLQWELVPRYEAIRIEYDQAMARKEATDEELDHYMWNTWPHTMTRRFRDDITTYFPYTDSGLHDSILSIQFPLCQAVIDEEDSDFDN